jgi:putative ABC transport system ATP-binding protein
MSSLKVIDLCKTYIINKIQNNVLRNVNFEINDGEMVAIMGPSGSGKSTLLYVASGMDNLTAGKVDYFGKEISILTNNEMSDLRLNEMGFIFQQMHMLKNLSIYDNIILPAYQSKKGKDKKEINDKAKELMHKLGISEIAENDTNEVSGGQLQRACICRSLINTPKMIFADEPTGALNQQNSREVMKELNRINQEGTTIMLVTHDMKVAIKCDKIMYIEDGSIKGEMALEKFTLESSFKERERKVSNWLMEMGW